MAFAQTTEQRNALRYRNAVRKLLRFHFGLTEEAERTGNALFEEYLGVDDRLYSLLENPDINPAFKARGLAQSLVPFYGYGGDSYYPFGKRSLRPLCGHWVYSGLWSHTCFGDLVPEHRERVAEALTPHLRAFLTDLLVYSAKILAEAPCSDLSAHDHRNGHIFVYNTWIIFLMELYREDGQQLERLFKSLHLEATVPVDGANGYMYVYQSFALLLTAAVPEEWKQRGNALMRQEVLQRETASRPLQSSPYVFYFKRVVECARMENLPYSRELLATQAAFTLEHAAELGDKNWLQENRSRGTLYGVARRLLDTTFGTPDLRPLRFAIIRQALGTREFVRINPDDINRHDKCDFIRYLLRKVGKGDPQLSLRLQALLDDYTTAAGELAHRHASQYERELAAKAALLNRMK